MMSLLSLISISTLITFAQSSFLDCSDSSAPYGDANSDYVTFCDLNNTLREVIINKFEETTVNGPRFRILLPKTVRLIFHDCMGPEEGLTGEEFISICDGCIDTNNDAHSGLLDIMRPLNDIYLNDGNNWDQRMSRSDFWAAAGTIAIQYAAQLSQNGTNGSPVTPNDTLPYIPFYIGREDCSASPNVNLNNYPSEFKPFPNAAAGWDYNFNYFNQNFGYNEREYVAILGAHTLGRVHQKNSGYGTNPWVDSWDALDNTFYQFLLNQFNNNNLEWQQFKNNFTEDTSPNNNTRHEWRNTAGTGAMASRFVMLNSDMALVMDVDSHLDVTTGEVTCDYDDNIVGACGANEISKGFVEEYANNNQLWLNDFSAAFRKMILTGYDNDADIPIDLDTLGEPWYMDEYNITYPTLSPTTAPTIPTMQPSVSPTTPTAPPTSPYCNSYVNYTQIWDNIRRFRERSVGQDYLISASQAFIDAGNAECVDGRTADELAYYYDFTHDGENDILTLDMIFCCGDNKIFDVNAFDIPNGFASNGNGDAFLGDDEDDESAIQLKEILVVSISILILICCCVIGGLVCYKKCYLDKKYESKALEAQVNNTVNKNNEMPDPTNIVVQASFTEGTQSGNYSREPSSVTNEPGHVIR